MPGRALSPQTWPEEGPEAERSAATTSLERWPKACPRLGLLQISRRGEGSVAWKTISSSNSRSARLAPAFQEAENTKER